MSNLRIIVVCCALLGLLAPSAAHAQGGALVVSRGVKALEAVRAGEARLIRTLEGFEVVSASRGLKGAKRVLPCVTDDALSLIGREVEELALEETGPHVVIVGGSYGGRAALERLEKSGFRVTVIDKDPAIVRKPRLWKTLVGKLPEDSHKLAEPLEHIGKKGSPTAYVQASVESVEDGAVVLAGGERVSYDALILAPGSQAAYFGHPEWAEHVLGLETLEDTLAIRDHVHRAIEQALQESDPVRRREILSYVTVGGGPTGVELAGAVGGIIAKRAPQLLADARIVLVQGGERIVPAYSEEVSAKTLKSLKELGVEVRTSSRVVDVTSDGVTLESGEQLEGQVLWGAGVEGAPVLSTLPPSALDRSGRVLVESDLRVPGLDNVYVIGDAAAAGGSGSKKGAKYMGETAAENVLRSFVPGNEAVSYSWGKKMKTPSHFGNVDLH